MLVGTVLAVIVAAVVTFVVTFDYAFGDDHSPSYQAGYTSGRSGAARIGAPLLGPQVACQGSFVKAQLANASLDSSDYLQGCLAGLHDDPPGS